MRRKRRNLLLFFSSLLCYSSLVVNPPGWTDGGGFFILKEDTYDYQVIPVSVIENWEGRRFHLTYVNKEDDAVYDTLETEIFTLEVIDDYTPGSSQRGGYPAFSGETESAVIKVLDYDDEGIDFSDSDDLGRMFLQQFLLNPKSQGFALSSLLLENIRFNTDKTKEEIEEAIERRSKKPLCDSDMNRLSLEAEFASPYISDLRFQRLNAPRGSSFFLGECPLLLLNPIDEDSTHNLFFPFAFSGTVLFMPLSPECAVMFYDSAVYDVKNTTLTRKDVESYNTVILSLSSGVILRNVEKESERYRKAKDAITEDTSIKDFFPSILSIRKGAALKCNIIRPYSEELLEYDRKYLGEKENPLSEVDMINRSFNAFDMLLKDYHRRSKSE